MNTIERKIDSYVRKKNTGIEQPCKIEGHVVETTGPRLILLKIFGTIKETGKYVEDVFQIEPRLIEDKYELGKWGVGLRYSHTNHKDEEQEVSIEFIEEKTDKYGNLYNLVKYPTVNYIAVEPISNRILDHTMGIPFDGNIRKSSYIYNRIIHEDTDDKNIKIINMYFGPFVIKFTLNKDGIMELIRK